VREVLLSARSRRYPRWHSPVQPKKLFDQRFRNICWSECEPSFGLGILPNKKIGQRLARFRQINMDNAVTHHDALEFPDGHVVLLTRLCVGQRATVLQLPAAARPEPRENQATPEVCEPALSS
jgi:hypothetical protein